MRFTSGEHKGNRCVMPDLGYTEKSSDIDPSTAATKEQRFPDLTIRDENVAKVRDGQECELGEEYTATVRLRVKGMSEDEYGSRLEFDVLSIDDFEPADGGDDDVEEEAPPKNGKKTPKALRYE